MKKMILMMLSIALICSFTVTAFATGQGVSASDVEAKNGERVYVTITLNEAVIGNSIGIQYTYDSKVLKPVPSASYWSVEGGMLQSFDNKDVGVWGTQTPKNLEGTLCVLAFDVKDGAEFSDTSVNCSVMIKNGSQDVGSYDAESKVAKFCNHTYGQWSDVGIAGHSRKCISCKKTETASHSWDTGVQTTDPRDPEKSVMLYTCSVCAGTKQSAIPGTPKPTEPKPTEPQPTEPKPTAPQVTNPTFPTKPTDPPTEPTLPIVTRPTEPQQNDGNKEPAKPTNPVNPTNPTVPANTEKPQDTTQPTYKDYNQSQGTNDPSSMPQPEIVIGESEQDHDGHEHGLIDEPPMVVTMDPDNVQIPPDEHDHDHDHDEIIQGYPADVTTEDGGNPIVTIVAVVATVAVLCGLGLWIIKKKKR